MKKGFTLVELLIVVLIIGILSAVAVPMYQGAVDKSRWSTLLTSAKALQTAQEAAHMETGSYAYDLNDLSIGLAGEVVDGNKYQLEQAQYIMDTKAPSQSMILGQTDTLPNVRLSMALKMPDTYLFCDAKAGDARAERLCGKLLMGQKAGSKDGYSKYLLDYPGPCAWANSTGQCYVSEEARCTALGMPYGGGICGYVNTDKQEINEGGQCSGTSSDHGACKGSIVNEGGICIGNGANHSCQSSIINSGGVCESVNANSCNNLTVNGGGTCNGNGGGGCSWGTFAENSVCNGNKVNTCRYGTFNEGSRCNAYVKGTCTGTYNGGCCEDYGKGYCPADAPKC